MILYLHGAPAFGAVERYVVQLVEGLRGGEAICVAFPDVDALAPFHALAGDGVRLLPLDARLVAGPAPALAAAVARLVRRERPRVVHVTDTWPPAIVGARLGGARRILLTHHTPELSRRDSLTGRVWWTLQWLARPEVVYTSETDRRGDGRRRLRRHVVELGIDIDRFAAVARRPPGGAVIGCVARLAPQKGLETLIAALPLVRTMRPDARLVIVGEGALREELAAQARTLGLSEAVELAGARTDVPAELARFDVFALPSHFEGLCLAVIEAQAAGVPVVATPVGGIRETIIDRETGLLVPVNDPAALAAAILRLLADPGEAARLAAEARRRALERFPVERMVRETRALYA